MILSKEHELKWPEAGVTRLPGWLYSDPSIFAREQEHIFQGRSWAYLCLEEEIPAVGDYVVSRIGTVPVIAVRNADGIAALVNRCAHRGATICRQASGSAREFVCPYHQWAYGLDGALKRVPFQRGYNGQGGMPESFHPSAHGLQRLHVETRHGVAFASFADDMEPLEEYLGDAMLAYFDRVFDGRQLAILGHMHQRIPGNWKLMFENIKDPYHASLLHVFLVTFGLFRLDQESTVEMDPTGRHAALTSRKGEQTVNEATSAMRSFRADFKLQGQKLLDPVREFPGNATVVMQTIWPNLIVQQQSNTLAVRQIVPLDAGSFDLRWTFFGYADDDEAMRDRRLRQANLMGPAGFVSVDDSEVMLLCQQGLEIDAERDCVAEMGGDGVDDALHMVTETAIRAFYRYYREVMAL